MIYALMGPTASGKTDIAIALAKELNCDVISVDSAMVYRDMNIGTAKPKEENRQGVKHHLIDILDARESYSVAHFVEQAQALIKKNIANNKPSILVGGTMLYFNALLHGLPELPSSKKEQLLQFQEILNKKGSSFLFSLLKEKDPLSAAHLHPKDHQRIIRALCIQEISGKSRHEYFEKAHSFPYPYKAMAMVPENRDEHRQAIATRFTKMLQDGFADEVEKLHARSDLNSNLSSTKSVGYRQWWQYLDGHIDRKTAIEKAITATCQLAKRQRTWLNRFPEATKINIAIKNLKDDFFHEKFLQLILH